MKTEKNKKCKKDCGCPSTKKNKSQNGKGDKPRPVHKKNYNQNYDKIDWRISEK